MPDPFPPAGAKGIHKARRPPLLQREQDQEQGQDCPGRGNAKLFEFSLLSVLKQQGIVHSRLAQQHLTGYGRLRHKDCVGRKAIRILAVLPCVALPVQAHDPVAFRLRQEACPPGVHRRAGNGSVLHVLLLHLDIIVITIVPQVNRIPYLQAVGLRQGLGQDADPAPAAPFPLRKVTAFHDSGLLPDKHRLMPQLLHRQHREAFFRRKIILRPALQLCHGRDAVVRDVRFCRDKLTHDPALQIREPIILASFILINFKPIPLRVRGGRGKGAIVTDRHKAVHLRRKLFLPQPFAEQFLKALPKTRTK